MIDFLYLWSIDWMVYFWANHYYLPWTMEYS